MYPYYCGRRSREANLAELEVQLSSLECELTHQATNLSKYEEQSTYVYTASLEKVYASKCTCSCIHLKVFAVSIVC